MSTKTPASSNASPNPENRTVHHATIVKMMTKEFNNIQNQYEDKFQFHSVDEHQDKFNDEYEKEY